MLLVAPALVIETVDATEPVPEPTTIFGSALALSLGGWLKRKKLSPRIKHHPKVKLSFNRIYLVTHKPQKALSPLENFNHILGYGAGYAAPLPMSAICLLLLFWFLVAGGVR
jgi:hypothetical protein